jgi:hypothetical protein
MGGSFKENKCFLPLKSFVKTQYLTIVAGGNKITLLLIIIKVPGVI